MNFTTMNALMLALASLTDTLNNPNRFHAAVVHLPVGVSVLGVFLIGYLCIIRGRAHHARWCIVLVYIIGLACSMLASNTGGKAMDEAGTLHGKAANATMAAHESM